MKLAHEAYTSLQDGQEVSSAQAEIEMPSIQLLVSPVRRAVARTRHWLIDRQHAEGCWCAELEGDSILESETILLLAYFGRERSPLAQRCARYLLQKQLPGGGWAMYPGGGVEISGSVKAYFALKLTGHDPNAESMQRARTAILAHGGADAVNSYTRFFLALLGQIPYEQCPAVPPEMTLLPRWSPVNLNKISAWSRTIFVPLSIVWASQPVRQIAPHLGVSELFLCAPQDWPPLRCPGLPGGTGLLSWDRFFRTADGLMKFCQRRRWLPLRSRALAKARRWMLDHFQGSDGVGAIYPPIVWSWLALHCLGYADTSREVRYCEEQLEALVIDDAATDAARLQPCKSPVWDTAIAMRALALGDTASERPALRQAARWLLDRQIRRRGDWSETVAAKPGGWCFEYHNDFYPDNDDTAMVLMALRTQFADDAEPNARAAVDPALHEGDRDPREIEDVNLMARSAEAIDRGLHWLLAMQNSDGGWGAFSRDNNCQFLCYVPFADHNAMIDPSTPDLTGRVVEALGQLGYRASHPAVARAIAYIRQSQEPDGSWFGRWGVNYIYGTWQVLAGLAAAGVPGDDPAIVAGANWLLAHQQACGGWGESPASYDQPHLRGQGTPTASQTAWAVMGLLAAGLEKHPAVVRAIRFLTLMQEESGDWRETEFTGTGFPRVFYLRYHYYPIYFPLMALSRWLAKISPWLESKAAPPLRVGGD